MDLEEDTTLALPGEEFVLQGIEDLTKGRTTRESLLVSIARSAIAQKGYSVAPPLPLKEDPELALYKLLAETEGDNAHSAYNALLGRLNSFLRT